MQEDKWASNYPLFLSLSKHFYLSLCPAQNLPMYYHLSLLPLSTLLPEKILLVTTLSPFIQKLLISLHQSSYYLPPQLHPPTPVPISHPLRK